MLTETAAGQCGLVSREEIPAVDDAVKRALKRWPGVPAVYAWLALDRRGEWRLRNPANGAFERIGNGALRAFIARNYTRDAQGAWYFQNGPQRVYVRLEATPMVYRRTADGFRDHCEREARPIDGVWVDEHGALYLSAPQGAGVLDDRDLAAVAGLLEDRAGDPLDADFDWRAARAGDAWLRLGPRVRLAVEPIARAALEKRFNFIADPQG
jgi:hypothetical protein